MGNLIDEEKLRKGLDKLIEYAGNESAKAGLQIVRDTLVPECRDPMLSPAEIEAGIEWLKTNDKLNYPRYNAVDLINLLYAVLKKPERTWGHIFKVEEKKDDSSR